MKRNVRLRCPFRKGTCEITRKTRRQCQACRLRKCLESGMKKESECPRGRWLAQLRVLGQVLEPTRTREPMAFWRYRAPTSSQLLEVWEMPIQALSFLSSQLSTVPT